MNFTEDTQPVGYTIRSYEPGAITVAIRAAAVNDAVEATAPRVEVLTRSFIIAPDTLRREWLPQQVEELQPEHLAALLALQPELVLLGCGRRFRFPATAVMQALAERGIGMEVMDTGATCRTYSVLAAEGRRVVAALLMGE